MRESFRRCAVLGIQVLVIFFTACKQRGTPQSAAQSIETDRREDSMTSHLRESYQVLWGEDQRIYLGICSMKSSRPDGGSLSPRMKPVSHPLTPAQVQSLCKLNGMNFPPHVVKSMPAETYLNTLAAVVSALSTRAVAKERTEALQQMRSMHDAAETPELRDALATVIAAMEDPAAVPDSDLIRSSLRKVVEQIQSTSVTTYSRKEAQKAVGMEPAPETVTINPLTAPFAMMIADHAPESIRTECVAGHVIVDFSSVFLEADASRPDAVRYAHSICEEGLGVTPAVIQTWAPEAGFDRTPRIRSACITLPPEVAKAVRGADAQSRFLVTYALDYKMFFARLVAATGNGGEFCFDPEKPESGGNIALKCVDRISRSAPVRRMLANVKLPCGHAD